MSSIEQTGRTVEQAIQAALEALQVSREEVDVEVLAQESRGLLGILGYSEAKVRVTLKAGLAQRTVEILQQICDHMGLGVTPKIVADEPDGVHIEIESDADLGLLIGRRGQTLASLQLIVAMIANREQPLDKRRRIILDAGGYRERRERALRSMARSAAARVKRSGRSVTLEPLSARERRIVHLALADDTAVITRSEGDDPNRYIVVAPRRTRRT